MPCHDADHTWRASTSSVTLLLRSFTPGQVRDRNTSHQPTVESCVYFHFHLLNCSLTSGAVAKTWKCKEVSVVLEDDMDSRVGMLYVPPKIKSAKSIPVKIMKNCSTQIKVTTNEIVRFIAVDMHRAHIPSYACFYFCAPVRQLHHSRLKFGQASVRIMHPKPMQVDMRRIACTPNCLSRSYSHAMPQNGHLAVLCCAGHVLEMRPGAT